MPRESLCRFARPALAGLGWSAEPDRSRDPLDKNLYELPPEECAGVPSVPDVVRRGDAALGRSPAPVRGDVFNHHFISNWLEMKQRIRLAPLRPHPSSPDVFDV